MTTSRSINLRRAFSTLWTVFLWIVPLCGAYYAGGHRFSGGRSSGGGEFVSRKLFPIVCLFVAIGLLLFASPAQAQYSWTTNADNTLTITGYLGTGGPVTIPSVINGLPVACIGDYAFCADSSSSANVTAVTIPNSVTSIGNDAFLECASLTTLSIPSSVTNIGTNAFVDCNRLTAIVVDPQNPFFSSSGGVVFDKSQSVLLLCPDGKTGTYAVPEGVRTIAGGYAGGDSAFYGCQITGITIPTSVTSIGNYAFLGSALRNVTIPNSVTNLGAGAFAQSELVEVTISNSIPSIQDHVFYNCVNLNAVTIPNSVTSIGALAFWGCRSLTNIAIPSGVTNIGDEAFSGCEKLTNAPLGRAVANISDEAFLGCYSLANLIIPASVTNIGNLTFAGCLTLTNIYFLGNPPTTDPFAFENDDVSAVYYLPGSVGWGQTLNGIPALMWNPEIQTGDANFGVRGGKFGFNIAGTSGLSVVVEACTHLATPVWKPLATMTLTNGSVYFSVPVQTNIPARFYRISPP